MRIAASAWWPDSIARGPGGGGEIRTRGGVAATRLFESRTLNRSDTPPGLDSTPPQPASQRGRGNSGDGDVWGWAFWRARWRATFARLPQLRMLHHFRWPVGEVSLNTQRHWGFSQTFRRAAAPWISWRAIDSARRAAAPPTGSPWWRWPSETPSGPSTSS